jgi:flagellar basal body-associated protein FliL
MERVLKIVLIVVAVLLIVSVSAYFVKNSKKNNSDSEVDQSVFEQACQESGYIYVGEDQLFRSFYYFFFI